MKSSMWQKVVLTGACALAGAMCVPVDVMAVSGGRANSGGQNRTGSPGALGTCSGCHSGGQGVTNAELAVLDSTNMPVTELLGGQDYTVRMSVSSTALSMFGAQLVVLDANDASTGAFGTVNSPNTILSTAGMLDVLEHGSRSSSGVFEATWTAPSNSDIATFYFVGLGINGNFGTSGDVVSAPQAVSFDVVTPCTDIDMDDICDDVDDDDDNDGVLDSVDSAPTNPDVCADADQDSCDDCAVGTDNFGPLSDATPLSDGPDADADGLCDAGDLCEGDNTTADMDGDGICGNLDVCMGDDATGDMDADGVCDDLDVCMGDDAAGDTDGDDICDDGDICLGDNATGDTDADGICDSADVCQGDDATGDTDIDGVCDDLDVCQGDDSLGDADDDGVCDVPEEDMGMADMGSDMAEVDMAEVDMDVADMDVDVDMMDVDMMDVDMAEVDMDVSDMAADLGGVSDMAVGEDMATMVDMAQADMAATADMGVAELPLEDGEFEGSRGCCAVVEPTTDTSKGWGFLLLGALVMGWRRRRINHSQDKG